jgi:hypothetical protein
MFGAYYVSMVIPEYMIAPFKSLRVITSKRMFICDICTNSESTLF